MSAKSWHIEEGKPYPMGATLTSKGANFTLFSINAEKVELCLFDKDKETRLEMPSRRGSVFYGFVPDVKAGQRYGFRVYGRENAEYGSCFNPNKLLIDPYSKKIDGKPSYRNAEEMAWFRPEDERDNAAVAPKSVVVGRSRFNWAKDC
ncbi:MAG: glycogen debranching enzyme, partial [Neisseria sp.]|nr:glycogen debranching enzyme [Neisseria sp.]